MSCGSIPCSSAYAPSAIPDASSRRRPLTSRRRQWRAAIERLPRLCDRCRQRQDLLELDDRLLADLGLTREQARREAEKPFWR